MCPLLQVFDMPAALRFYRDALGFVVVESSAPGDAFDWGLLQLGDSWLMLNTAYESHERPPGADPVRSAAHADTEIYFRCDDVDAVYNHLIGRGVQPEPPRTTPYGMRQLYVKDPDGYVLCFQHPA